MDYITYRDKPSHSEHGVSLENGPLRGLGWWKQYQKQWWCMLSNNWRDELEDGKLNHQVPDFYVCLGEVRGLY